PPRLPYTTLFRSVLRGPVVPGRGHRLRGDPRVQDVRELLGLVLLDGAVTVVEQVRERVGVEVRRDTARFLIGQRAPAGVLEQHVADLVEDDVVLVVARGVRGVGDHVVVVAWL